MSTINLNGEWNLSGGDIKCKAQIPGDFHSALFENNIIEDPYKGFNESKIQWIAKTDWTIEREFDFETVLNSCSFIEIKAADTFFTLYLNEKKVGSGNNAFLRYRFDVTKFLKNGKNKIKLFFESAENKANDIAKKLPYPVPYMKYDMYSPNRNLVRKCQCHGGWDWGPCLMVSGIYGSITLETVSCGLFDFVKLNYTKSTKDKTWVTKVNTQFDSIVEDDKEFVFTISGPDIESVSFNKSIHLQKGKNLIDANLKVNNPHVWMTAGELKEAGLKENTIYNLNIKISDSNDKEINQHFCFSSLKAISKKDKVDGKTGRSIYFENNGRKIFAKGSNWIPADSLPSRMTENRYEDLLRSAVEANQNCIRVWGGGYYEKDYFYELCDKLGIMVWQDCMFACSLYPITTDFLENVSKEIEYQVNRLQSHACIAIWCGNNENFGTLNWFPESINNRDRYLVDYDRLYIDTIGRKIKDEDPSRIFWPSSPCAGPDDFADNWHADSMGDMHYWSVWHERKSFDAYLSIRPRFVSEFGYESFPSLETIKSFATEEDFNFTSKLMEYHQRSPSGNSIILENFSRYFRFPNGFESMIYLSQVQQALAIKTAVDWWRSLMPNCMGALIWQLNDVWPCPSWSSLEYNGKWKLLHYETRKFFDIVYMPLYIKEKKLYANICNETNDNLELQVNINYYKFDGSYFAKSKLIKKTVEAQSVTNVLEECVDEENKNEFFIYATYEAKSKNGHQYKGENLVFPGLYKHAHIANTNIKYNICEVDENFEITLESDKPAFFVSLDNDNLSGRFDDNMFTLIPGNKKKVVFKPSEKCDLKKINESISVRDLRSTF